MLQQIEARMTKKIFKCELSFKKLKKIHFCLTHKECVILSVQYRLCFTKVCLMGDNFDKDSFTLGTKLNVLKNFLLRD